jgi:HK97 gp10 family phage protein
MEQFKHIEGADELERRLRELPVKLEKKILRAACRAAAKVIQQEVEARVPRKTGALAESIRVSTSFSASKGEVRAKVVAGGKQAFYATFVEKGTKPHIIRAKVVKRLAIGGAGIAAVFPISVQHPGARAMPFMVPALEAKFEDAVDAAGKYIAEHLPEALE